MKPTHCKLKKNIQLGLLEHFVLEVAVRSAADLPEIHPSTATLSYRKARQIISHYLSIQATEIFEGCVEPDESYLGGIRKGKGGRGAADRVAVSGILKRGGKVYTVVVTDTKPGTPMPVIARKIAPDSMVYTDSYGSHDALDASDFHHHRINHSTHFAEGKNHINGIENFWNQGRRVSRKYNGIDKNSFPLFLKECEFRFNHGTPRQQLKILKLWCDM